MEPDSPSATKRPKIDPSCSPPNSAAAEWTSNAWGKQPEPPAATSAASTLDQAPPIRVSLCGTHKLIIKNLPPAQDRAAKLLEHHTLILQGLAAALDGMLLDMGANMSYERIYRSVEDLCRFGNAEQVISMVDEKLRTHASGLVRSRLVASSGGDLLAVLRKTCEEFADWIRKTVRGE
jgi:cullin-4